MLFQLFKKSVYGQNVTAILVLLDHLLSFFLQASSEHCSDIEGHAGKGLSSPHMLIGQQNTNSLLVRGEAVPLISY